MEDHGRRRVRRQGMVRFTVIGSSLRARLPPCMINEEWSDLIVNKLHVLSPSLTLGCNLSEF